MPLPPIKLQKHQLILISGIALGIIAILMVQMHIKNAAETERKKAQKALEKARANQVVVLVARQDLASNTVIEANMLETLIVPREYVQPQAASALDNISGMVTIAPISKGEQVTLTKLSSGAGAVKRSDLSSITPTGKRAVPVTAENISELVGLIKPGNYVDVIAVITMPTEDQKTKRTVQQTIIPAFQNVLVLAVGQETSAQLMPGKGKAQEKSPLVTLALTPEEANILAFLQEQGKIRLSIRGTTDSQIHTVKPVTWENIFQYLPDLRPQEEQVESVEIYRGLNKERLPLSK